MTKSLAERSTKTSAIKIIGAVGADPEANRGEKIKVKNPNKLLQRFDDTTGKKSVHLVTFLRAERGGTFTSLSKTRV